MFPLPELWPSPFFLSECDQSPASVQQLCFVCSSVPVGKSLDQARTWWFYRCGYLSSVNTPVSGIYDALGCSHLLKPMSFLDETPADPPASKIPSEKGGQSSGIGRGRPDQQSSWKKAQRYIKDKDHQRSNIYGNADRPKHEPILDLLLEQALVSTRKHLCRIRSFQLTAGLGASASCWFHILSSFHLMAPKGRELEKHLRKDMRQIQANIGEILGLGHTLLFSPLIHFLISSNKV